MSSAVTYLTVCPSSPEAEAVQQIQEQYKAFFFVRFSQLESAVADGHILAAIDGSRVVGYVWSVVRNGVVKIRYLAVDPTSARSGVGRGLVEEVIRRNQAAYCIRLSCRTDYPGWTFWKRVGFTAMRNRPGQAKQGSTLTDFYYELSPLPLFAGQGEAQNLTLVAIDANVFFDLVDDSRPHHEESSGLLADWLSAEVDLCVTAAIHEDFERGPTPQVQRQRLRTIGKPHCTKSLLTNSLPI